MGASGRISFFKTEDGWAIIIGWLILATGSILFITSVPDDYNALHEKYNKIMASEGQDAPFKTLLWHRAFQDQQELRSDKTAFGQFLSKLTGKTHNWSINPLFAFYQNGGALESPEQDILIEEQQLISDLEKKWMLAKDKEAAAREAGFENPELNLEAKHAILEWISAEERKDNLIRKRNQSGYNQVPYMMGLFVLLALLFGVGMQVMEGSFFRFFKGFVFIFVLGILSYTLSSQTAMNAIGFGYAAWAIIIGLVISNTVGTPSWVKPAVKTEFFIKTGLVLLGAEILFGKILTIGLPGIFIAWVVTPIVLVTTYWFGQRILGIASKTLNITISADMSVCGVSAAVAVAAACRAKKEELTLAIGLSMIFTSIMMIVLPLFIKWIRMNEVLGGAWIGGTIDATGAVVAAGAFLGDNAMTVAATIKMIQNVLIGVIAFFVAIYFTMKVDRNGKNKLPVTEIWYRFPKFILGFIGASIIFSGLYGLLGKDMGYTVIDNGIVGAFSSDLRGWLFCLAFVSIGLATNFRELKHHFKGGKPLILYLTGQTFNLAFTLLMAYVMFYLVFPEITDMITN